MQRSWPEPGPSLASAGRPPGPHRAGRASTHLPKPAFRGGAPSCWAPATGTSLETFTWAVSKERTFATTLVTLRLAR